MLRGSRLIRGPNAKDFALLKKKALTLPYKHQNFAAKVCCKGFCFIAQVQ